MQQFDQFVKPLVIDGEGFEDTWIKLLAHVLRGESVKDARGMETKEVLNCITYVANPKCAKYPRRFFEMVMETDNKAYLLEALIKRDLEWIPYQRLTEYPAPKSATVNQVEHLVKMVKKWPSTRRAVASTYYPPDDCDGSLEKTSYELPALQIIDLKPRDGRLNLICYFRSSEVYFWWPVNAFQLTKFMEEIAPRCQLATGSLAMMLSSAHIVDAHLEKARLAVDELSPKPATKPTSR